MNIIQNFKKILHHKCDNYSKKNKEIFVAGEKPFRCETCLKKFIHDCDLLYWQTLEAFQMWNLFEEIQLNWLTLLKLKLYAFFAIFMY